MKVVIPVVDVDSHKFTIANGLNESVGLCVYDTIGSSMTWIEKSSLVKDDSGLLPDLLQKDFKHIVTKGVQPMALNVLMRNGFVVYKSMGDDLMVNIELLDKELLPVFNMVASLAECKPCGGSCNSCNSTTCKN